MIIKKVKNSYNDYDITLSWGQLEAIRTALEQNHSDSLSDELLAEISWYTERIPGPGEDEEDAKAQDKAAGDLGAGGLESDGDLPVALPPGHQAGTPPGGGAEPPGFPPRGGAGKHAPSAADKLLGKGAAKPPGKGLPPKGGSKGGLPEPGFDDGGEEPQGAPGAKAPTPTDKRVPKPPAE